MCFEARENEWADLMTFMPEFIPGGDTREEAMTRPGNCLKSKERNVSGMPEQHGRLLFIDEDRAVVLGYNDVVSPAFVWRGSIHRYYQVWDID